MSKQSKNVILSQVSVDTFNSITSNGGFAFGISPYSASNAYYPSASNENPFPIFTLTSLANRLTAAGSSSKEVAEIIGLIDSRINNGLVKQFNLNSYLLTGSTYNEAYEYAFQSTKRGNLSFNHQTTLSANTANSTVLGASSSAWVDQYLHPSSSYANYYTKLTTYSSTITKTTTIVVPKASITFVSASTLSSGTTWDAVTGSYFTPAYDSVFLAALSQSIATGSVAQLTFDKTLLNSYASTTGSVKKLIVSGYTSQSLLANYNTIIGGNAVIFVSASRPTMGNLVTSDITFTATDSYVLSLNPTTSTVPSAVYTESGTSVSSSNQAFEARYPKTTWTNFN
jgi:hypothetical protein